MTITTEMVLYGLRREEPGKIMKPTHVLLLPREETHSRADSISPRGLVHLIIRYFDDPTAKNPAALSPMTSDFRKRMINLALTQFDFPERTIQSRNYPTSAR